MPAAKVENRSATIQIRVTPREKRTIHTRARRVRLKPAEFIRRAALGSDFDPAVEEAKEELSAVSAGLTSKGHVVKGHPRVKAEIAESKLTDDPAREAFIDRRTRELFGQGRTTLVARREAEAEWRRRGAP